MCHMDACLGLQLLFFARREGGGPWQVIFNYASLNDISVAAHYTNNCLI